jgi:uncharacterized protein YdeI (YjbR/CyaY-like superfamily)
MTARYFRSPADFRRWLEAHHADASELLVGFYKKASGKPGISYKEAVDEALCFGWIDGIKKGVDEHRYTHRFTPRKAVSTWSVTNVTRVTELIALKRMAAPGLAAFARRDSFFRAQPPGYQRLATFWVMSAKQPATRERRLAGLMKSSAEGKRILQ